MFSVLIPVYNHERYLAECVLSAVRSPLVSEVLLFDDGSSDSSPALARRLAGGALPKVRDITPPNRGNRGAHATLNELAQAASADWLAILNSDDVFTPSRFELIARQIRGTHFDLLFGNVLVIDPQGKQTGGKRAMFDPQLPFPANFDVPRMAIASDWLPLLAHQNIVATTSNIVFRKSLWRSVGGFADLRYIHDWDFCLRAALLGKVEYVPHALTGYRLHASNTIKEDSSKVDREVQLMFERLQRDFPALRSNESFAEGLAANPYLKHRTVPTLSVVLPPYAEVYAQALEQTVHQEPEAQYLYAPSSATEALSPVHLQNALLALEMRDLDFILVSHTLAEPPTVGLHSLRNAAVFRRSLADTFLSGNPPGKSRALKGQIARLFPGGGSIHLLSDLLPSTEIVSAPPRSSPIPTSLRPPKESARPLIFVLPALFAVGGVERLVIDMMRELSDRFRFVVITVERLNERQGTLHGPAEGACLAFYDLAELAPPNLFLPMLERLRDVYHPALVWIPNGSPWQCDHAPDIRKVFANIPIVDQEAYDTEAGWIQRYNEPGVRSYDRFIAINRKIEQTMIRTYGISPERIDMIYHSVNLQALGPAERTAEQKREYRHRYGLPEDTHLLGWVGRFTVQKRPLEFLQFVRETLSAHFVMIGDGELGAVADRYIADHALQNVTRIRFSDHMGELFSVMDGLLSVSAYEGLPISMLEALAMGVPIYSTDVGDVALILNDYQTGLVTDAEWDLNRYRENFRTWFENISRYRKNAEQAAPAIRKRLGSAAVAKEYENCFRSAGISVVNATLKGSKSDAISW